MTDPLNCVLLLQLIHDPFIDMNSARMALDVMAMKMEVGQSVAIDNITNHNEFDVVGLINGDIKFNNSCLFAYWEDGRLVIDRFK